MQPLSVSALTNCLAMILVHDLHDLEKAKLKGNPF